MLLDGATGTEMMRAGMPSGVCPEEWIASHPDAILELQARYRNAGSDALLAPTFGANRSILARYGLAEGTVALNEMLIGLSKKAAGRICLVGADLSPTGKYLAPIGDTDFDEMVSIYAEQIMALDASADFFIVETNMDLAAARAAAVAVREYSEKPVFVTLTVMENGHTMSGDTPEAAFLALSELGIAAFGLNCSTGPMQMLNLMRPLVPLSLALEIPLIAKPNAGAPTSDTSADSIDTFRTAGAEFLSSGIWILGGCCGTDERHISALKYAMDNYKFQLPCTMEELPSPEKLACTNRSVAAIPCGNLPEPLDPDDDFPDNAADMAEAIGVAYLRLSSLVDAKRALEMAPLCSAPLLLCGNPDAAAYFKRRYPGKAPYLR